MNYCFRPQAKEHADIIQGKVDRLVRMRALDIASTPQCSVEEVRTLVAFAVAAFKKGCCFELLRGSALGSGCVMRAVHRSFVENTIFQAIVQRIFQFRACPMFSTSKAFLGVRSCSR